MRAQAHAHRGGVQAAGAKGGNARQGLEAQAAAFLLALITTTAAAPSLMPDALPAVTLPALSNAGAGQRGFGTGLAVEVLGPR